MEKTACLITIDKLEWLNSIVQGAFTPLIQQAKKLAAESQTHFELQNFDSDVVFGLGRQNLPYEFAGRVVKLEMKVEKGINFISVDDVNTLVDLYT